MPSKHKTIRFTAAVLAMLLIIVVVILFRMNGYTTGLLYSLFFFTFCHTSS